MAVVPGTFTFENDADGTVAAGVGALAAPDSRASAGPATASTVATAMDAVTEVENLLIVDSLW